jgi:hypothetical protein
MAGVLSSALACADDDDVVGPLRESIAAAPIIVEGAAERPYASWDGSDPTTIRTYTPFIVTRVLKGAQPAAHILLHQRGGDVGGVTDVVRGAEFSEGEQAIVFLGAQDPKDGSYEVAGGRRGKFVVQRDDSGRLVLDVRLGADASAYGRAEKAPGTGLARVPVELFEQLAAGGRIGSVADFERTQSRARNSSGASELNELKQPVAPRNPPAVRSTLRGLLAVALLASLVTGAWLTHRRARRNRDGKSARTRVGEHSARKKLGG